MRYDFWMRKAALTRALILGWSGSTTCRKTLKGDEKYGNGWVAVLAAQNSFEIMHIWTTMVRNMSTYWPQSTLEVMSRKRGCANLLRLPLQLCSKAR
jgi:hypothetical protein